MLNIVGVARIIPARMGMFIGASPHNLIALGINSPVSDVYAELVKAYCLRRVAISSGVYSVLSPLSSLAFYSSIAFFAASIWEWGWMKFLSYYEKLTKD